MGRNAHREIVSVGGVPLAPAAPPAAPEAAPMSEAERKMTGAEFLAACDAIVPKLPDDEVLAIIADIEDKDEPPPARPARKGKGRDATE